MHAGGGAATARRSVEAAARADRQLAVGVVLQGGVLQGRAGSGRRAGVSGGVPLVGAAGRGGGGSVRWSC